MPPPARTSPRPCRARRRHVHDDSLNAKRSSQRSNDSNSDTGLEVVGRSMLSKAKVFCEHHMLPYSVSDDGTVVAGRYMPSGRSPYYAFRWCESGEFDDLGVDVGGASFQVGLSGDGNVVIL